MFEVWLPPNHSGGLVIEFEYINSKGETVTVSDRNDSEASE